MNISKGALTKIVIGLPLQHHVSICIIEIDFNHTKRTLGQMVNKLASYLILSSLKVRCYTI